MPAMSTAAPQTSVPAGKSRFGGIIPPLVTPLSDRDALDLRGLHRLLNHVIAGGVSGVFILGTTGESPSLSYRLRRELIDQTVRIVNRRVPVLVGVSDTAFVETVHLAEHCVAAGADAVVLTTPYYFPAGQTELTSYVRRLAPMISLPIMLYNMPQLTKVWFDVETLKTLAAIDSIVGVKDSSGDLEYFTRVCELKSIRPDWSILIGPEAKLPQAIAAGGDGGVSGGANITPELFVGCYEALQSGKSSTVADLMKKINRLQDIYDIGKYASRHIKATKTALSILGICSDRPAEPFREFLPPERERVAAILADIGLKAPP